MTQPQGVDCNIGIGEDHLNSLSMEERVQQAESLLTELFMEQDREETPDWERVRGYPGALDHRN